MGFQGVDACMEALRALPDRWDARLAVPLAGEAATALGHAPHHLAERRWRLRWVAVLRHGITGVPLVGFKHDIARHLRIGATSHRDLVDAPRHHAIERHGVQQPRLRL
jgi:hypothetical protein